MLNFMLKLLKRARGARSAKEKRRCFLHLQQLEDRTVPTGFVWFGGHTAPGAFFPDHYWTNSNNWRDFVTGATPPAGRYPGSSLTTPDDAYIDGFYNPAIDVCILDGPLPASLRGLWVSATGSNPGELFLDASLIVTNGGRLTGGGIANISTTDNSITFTGGLFIWDGGNLGVVNGEARGENHGTVNLDGGTMQVSNPNGTDVELGFGINVGTFTTASELDLQNLGQIQLMGYGRGDAKTAQQITVGANGTVNITVTNSVGLLPKDTTVQPAVFTNRGTVVVSGTGTGDGYGIREPFYQNGGTLTIRHDNKLGFEDKTGTDNTADGNRGKSFFMEGSGEIDLEQGAILRAQKGFQMDAGSLKCVGSALFTTAQNWTIDCNDGANHLSKIRLNGGTYYVGDAQGIVTYNYGTLRLLTGAGANGIGVYWQAGNLIVSYNNTADSLSNLFTDSKTDVSDSGGNLYSVDTLGNNIPPTSTTWYKVIDTAFALTKSYDPGIPGFNTRWTTGFEIQMLPVQQQRPRRR